jgi:hypothetical protein
MQRNLQTPLSSSTQWEALDQRAPEVKPVFQHLEHVAAQGTVIHNDDSYVRIVSVRQAALLTRREPEPTSSLEGEADVRNRSRAMEHSG